eukprot:3254157-Prymnesium_polylepis.1
MLVPSSTEAGVDEPGLNPSWLSHRQPASPKPAVNGVRPHQEAARSAPQQDPLSAASGTLPRAASMLPRPQVARIVAPTRIGAFASSSAPDRRV